MTTAAETVAGRPLAAARPAERSAPAALTWNKVDQRALLDSLLADQLISAPAAKSAWSLHEQTGVHVVSGLLRLNAVAESPLYRAYAARCGVALLSSDAADLNRIAEQVQAGAEALGLSPAWLKLKGVIFIDTGAAWCVACRDEPSAEVLAFVAKQARMFQRAFQWALITPSAYDQVTRIQQRATQAQDQPEDLRSLRELAEEGPTIELVNAILSQAVTQRASDVHVEPEEHEFVVRVRVDGDMLEQTRQPRNRFDAVTVRLKILADLDIAEKRLPQDGRINARVNGESFDIRVSILPGALGESTVLRLLRQERKPTRLEDLGMSPGQAQMFERWAQLGHGIVLVTGPTGSGKSTTLYTGLELANDRSKKIITVEDPVEYKIGGITQLQVNADIGFTFAGALRSILRHDPDVIFVGEIRDEETARIAIQASLTGHLVLSTLHTNSAIGAVTRLIDMGIEPFLISASVRGLMAQRLVRRLCPSCAVPDDAPDEATITLVDAWRARHPGHVPTLRRPVGCAHCSGTGFHGRFAVYDLIEINADVAHHITLRASEPELLARLGREGDSGLLASGLEHVVRGTTTVGEVLRNASGGGA